MIRAIKMAMSDTTFSIHDELLGWSLGKKKPDLEALQSEDLEPNVFIKRGLELLFTESDDDITCEIGKTTKFPDPHFDVMYKGQIYQYTNLKIWHAPKKKKYMKAGK